jgi:cell wall-associated NlpC family hydrolase
VKSALVGLVALAALVVLVPVVVFAAVVGAIPTPAAVPTALPGVPADALAAYERAAAQCSGLSWTVLAGIGEVESDHGRSDLPGVRSGANAAGAEGPMQFLPATFAEYAVPGADGTPPSAYDLGDAAVAAARMLCADGAADPARLPAALFAYNHSEAYVADVLAWSARYQTAADAGAGTAGRVAAPATAGVVAAEWALTQLGKPYVWGATGPDAYDCSGLVLRAWQAAGVELPRVAADQFAAGDHVDLAQAQIGDLLFFAPDPADPATIDHVGIYLGEGLMVEAPHTGADVRVVAVYPAGLVSEVTRPWE